MPTTTVTWTHLKQMQHHISSSEEFIQNWQQFNTSPSMGNMVASLISLFVDSLVKVSYTFLAELDLRDLSNERLPSNEWQQSVNTSPLYMYITDLGSITQHQLQLQLQLHWEIQLQLQLQLQVKFSITITITITVNLGGQLHLQFPLGAYMCVICRY
jgi:hypothetical protein